MSKLRSSRIAQIGMRILVIFGAERGAVAPYALSLFPSHARYGVWSVVRI